MLIPIGGSSGFGLFVHIISLLIYPIVLTLISRACGHGILNAIFSDWSTRDIRISILVETTLGFFVFSTLMLVLGIFGMYTIIGLIVVLVMMSLVGWTGWKKTYTDISERGAIFENHTSGK